jgi:hypothetical protein
MIDDRVKGKTDKRVMLNIRCPKLWREKMKEVAKEKACSYSLILRDMIEVFLKERGKI